MFNEHCRIGNYHYASVPGLIRKKAQGETYIIGFACAYNALGLIGSERNGIFVLNETKRDVVLDEHMRIGTGWNGCKPEHIEELRKLKRMPAREFLGWIAGHPRAREQYRA